MTLINRIEKVAEQADELMKINQALTTKEERHNHGFDIIYDIKQNLRWIISDIEEIVLTLQK